MINDTSQGYSDLLRMRMRVRSVRLRRGRRRWQDIFKENEQAAMDQAAADVNAGRKESIWGPGLIAVCDVFLLIYLMKLHAAITSDHITPFCRMMQPYGRRSLVQMVT